MVSPAGTADPMWNDEKQPWPPPWVVSRCMEEELLLNFCVSNNSYYHYSRIYVGKCSISICSRFIIISI